MPPPKPYPLTAPNSVIEEDTKEEGRRVKERRRLVPRQRTVPRTKKKAARFASTLAPSAFSSAYGEERERERESAVDALARRAGHKQAKEGRGQTSKKACQYPLSSLSSRPFGLLL
jgi:hypothetical protein